MHMIRSLRALGSLAALAVCATALSAQARVTAADYARARGLAERYGDVVTGAAETPTWAGNARLWYRKSVEGGHTFMLVDVTNQEAPVKRVAFDHARIADALRARFKT